MRRIVTAAALSAGLVLSGAGAASAVSAVPDCERGNHAAIWEQPQHQEFAAALGMPLENGADWGRLISVTDLSPSGVSEGVHLAKCNGPT